MLAAGALAAASVAGAQGGSRPRPEAGIFRELEDSGVDFVQFNGAAGDYHLPEITCAGAALLDYDLDGDLDLYLLQGAPLGGRPLSDALAPPAGPEPLTDRLYRNDLTVLPDGRRRLRFVDVTPAAIPGPPGFGCGVAVGDFDGDGWPDLYVARVGPNLLLRNRGDGGFEDATAASGAQDARWSVPVVWADFDGDGRLDLFVGNYLEFDPERRKICRAATGDRDYCNPAAYEGVPDRIFRNRGDGTFEDLTVAAGIGRLASKSLGAVAADFNADGLPDLYVTNDGVENQLWIQRPGMRFTDEAMLAGCAVNRQGEAEASMGVDAVDFDDDGDLDLFMTHLVGETNTLYLNDGGGLFEDVTVRVGLGPPSLRFTSWGLAWLDYDNDGLRDLAIANGAVRAIDELAGCGDRYPFHQPNQLLHGLAGRRFEDAGAAAGTGFARSEISRALARGDLDNDGDSDLVLANLAGPARVLINQVGQDGRWIGVGALREAPGPVGPGSRVELRRRGGGGSWGRIGTDGSFAAANDPRVLFGLGGDGEVERLRVQHSGGRALIWSSPPRDCYLTVVEPTVRAAP